MVALATKLFDLIPAPVAAVLMLGGFIFYALGCIRLGYGAAVKPLFPPGDGENDQDPEAAESLRRLQNLRLL